MENVIRYRHAVNAGDLVASMAGLKSIYEQSGKKAIVYQTIGRPAIYAGGAAHPIKENGVQVNMNMRQFEMLKPLLLSQDYISDFIPHKGEVVDIDLDLIRSKIFVNLPYLAIQSWIFLAFPDMAFDLSRQWVNADELQKATVRHSSEHKSEISLTNKVLINFTERYRTVTLDYFFLKGQEENLVFTGTENERDIFCDRWNLDIPLLIVDDFLELAMAIKASKFLLSNQSFCWNLCESIKHPRLLELCAYAPNCQPFIGENSYGYFHGGACEYYFNKLLNS